MSWMTRLGGRLPDFAEVARRFPASVAVMAAFTGWLILENHFSLTAYKQSEYIGLGFIFAGYVSVIAALIVEARGGSSKLGGVVAFAFAALAFSLSYFSKNFNFTSVMGISGAILFLGNAAAWRMEREDRNVWNFTQKLWTGALFAAVGSVIFLLGMLAISEAVRALFGVNLDTLTMKTILPIGLAFLAPIYWLGTLPRFGEAEDVTELSFEARALSFLGTWMLAPLVIIYALIVLTYGVKILVQWDLPKGEIAQLVSPFIGVGMLVWLMLEPKVLKESGFVRFYRKAWHWVMLPAAVLLGVAVFVRVREYGFTLERFFLALVFVWSVVQSLWFTVLSKKKRDIRLPTALAAGLLIFGAFAARPISLTQQFQRAKAAKVHIASFEPDVIRQHPEQAKRFVGGLKYLVARQDKRRFKALLPDHKMPNFVHGLDFNQLLSSLGLDGANGHYRNKRKRVSLAAESGVNIQGNSKIYMVPSLWLNNSRKGNADKGIVSSQNRGVVVLSIDGEKFRVDFNDKLSNLEFVEADDTSPDLIVPKILIFSKKGASATLVISDGEVFYENERFTGGRISFAVIVPE